MKNSIFSENMENQISNEVIALVQTTLETLSTQKTKQEFFRPDEAAKYCGVSVPTLDRWEVLGLKFSKIRKVKLYSKHNLDLFILSHE